MKVFVIKIQRYNCVVCIKMFSQGTLWNKSTLYRYQCEPKLLFLKKRRKEMQRVQSNPLVFFQYIRCQKYSTNNSFYLLMMVKGVLWTKMKKNINFFFRVFLIFEMSTNQNSKGEKNKMKFSQKRNLQKDWIKYENNPLAVWPRRQF